MKIKKSKNKFCKLYASEIEYEQELNDPEVRLFHLYLRIVDWDKKHTDTFGSSNIKIRELKETFMTNWSTGKISYTRSSLIKKGWLEDRPDGRIGIQNYFVYRLRAQDAEPLIQRMRQGVQISEQGIQQDEKNGKEQLDNLKNEKANLSDKWRFPVQ